MVPPLRLLTAYRHLFYSNLQQEGTKLGLYAVDTAAIILTCHNNDNNDFQSIVLVYENDIFAHTCLFERQH